MSKKSRIEPATKKIYPKTNISKAYYKHMVDSIEHDPLVKHSTMTAACMIAAISILLGGLIWFAKSNPGNLIQTQAKITKISSGKTDTIGTISTFITFEFNPSRATLNNDAKYESVRQPTQEGIEYKEGQNIRIGYHPDNPKFARNLSDNRPPFISLVLWTIPFIIMIWFIFIALLRHTKRQELIWAAAEAADSDD